ncbi:MAG: Wzz/FepE/Etk N-terminal domain-containing protein [Bacteroidales bacterium]|nr:Wzz/FepE/Etk N-terminal domain-containing protein [Clostridium sp.]MCM1203280.1 Wzz/FepE/Etk N-terminal domain-containing protein [Bacteroidales bacterium]
MNEQRNDEMEIDLRELFYVLLGKIWIIILATALGLGVAAGYTTAFVQPIYSSTSMLYVMTKSTSITSLTDLQVGSSLTQDYRVFITSRPVVDKVIEELELDTTYGAFVSNVSVENPANTRFIYITVKNPDAYMAKTIVDKLTDVSAERMGTIMETEKPNVADYGHIPENQTSPNLTKNALVGALIGFILSVACILVIYLMNDSIQTAEDVEKYLGLNTLGLIPLEEGISKRGTRGHDKDAAKARRARRRTRRKQKKHSSAEE